MGYEDTCTQKGVQGNCSITPVVLTGIDLVFQGLVLVSLEIGTGTL